MKRQSLLLLVFAFLAHLLSAQVLNPIQVTGKVQFLNPDIFKKYNVVWLKKGIGRQQITVDSALIGEDGNFSFRIDSKPAFYQLDVLKWQTVTFWSNSNVHVSCRGYDTARVKSKNSGFIELESTSQVNKLLNIGTFGNLQDKILLEEILVEGIEAQRHRSTDSAWYNQFRRQNLYGKVEAMREERLKTLIRNHPENPGTVYLLTLLDRKRNAAFILAELERRPRMEEATQLKAEIETDLAMEKNASNGGTIPFVYYPGSDGKLVLLRPVKGKYLLIDFWASWCGPCRKSIPKIKALHALYKDKGLEFVSVSIDTDKEAWRQAMADEQMPWKQALSPDKDKTLRDFNIQGVPTLFLIDREDHIIEKFTGYNSKLETLLVNLMSKSSL